MANGWHHSKIDKWKNDLYKQCHLMETKKRKAPRPTCCRSSFRIEASTWVRFSAADGFFSFSGWTYLETPVYEITKTRRNLEPPAHIYIYIGLCMTFIVNYTFYVWYHEFIHVVHEFHCFNFEHPYRSHFHRGISPAPIAMAMDGTRSCEFSATQSWLECNRKLGM